MPHTTARLDLRTYGVIRDIYDAKAQDSLLSSDIKMWNYRVKCIEDEKIVVRVCTKRMIIPVTHMITHVAKNTSRD